MIIDYVNAPAGAGKTYGIINEAIDLARAAEKMLIVQPTKDLIEVTKGDLTKLAPGVVTKRFVSNANAAAVGQALHYLQRPFPDGQVIFMCHAGLDLLPDFPRREEWHVFYDEAPIGFWSEEPMFKETHRHLTDCLTAMPCPLDGYLSLEEKEGGGLRRLSDQGKTDDALQTLRKVIQELRAPHWACRAGS